MILGLDAGVRRDGPRLASMCEHSDLLQRLVDVADTLDWANEDLSSYSRAIALLKEITGAQLAPTFLLDETQRTLILVVDDEFNLVPSGFETMPAWMHVRPPWINDQEWPVSARDHVGSQAWYLLPEDFRAWFGTSGIVASLAADGKHLGAVLLCFDGDYDLTPQMAAFLAGVGRILGGYLYAIRIRRREREIGILQERRRLGDELHAGLSQNLAGLGLALGAARIDLDGDDRDGLHDDLQRMTALVDDTRKDLRQQMLGLRADSELATGTFEEQVSRRVADFEQYFGTPVCVEGLDSEGVPLPLAVGAQLIRVLQEALNNAHVHSRATGVTVTFHRTSTLARLEVCDNGAGFDPTQVLDSRLGLRIMRERLAQVQGRLSIETAAGAGTRVIAEVPLLDGREVAVL